jgi:hypothetical protein
MQKERRKARRRERRKEMKSCRKPMAYLVFIHITGTHKLENEGQNGDLTD